jgi:hypothetical protein
MNPEPLHWFVIVTVAVPIIPIAVAILALAVPGWRRRITSAGLRPVALLLLSALAAVSLTTPYVLLREPFGAWSEPVVGGLNIAFLAGTVLLLAVPRWRSWLVSQQWAPLLLTLGGLTPVGSYMVMRNTLAAWWWGFPLLLAGYVVLIGLFIRLDLSLIGKRLDPPADWPSQVPWPSIPMPLAMVVEFLLAFAMLGTGIMAGMHYLDHKTNILGFLGGLLAFVVYRSVRKRLVRRREQRAEAT